MSKSSYPKDPQYMQQPAGQQYPPHPSAPPAYPAQPPPYSPNPNYNAGAQQPPPYGYQPGPSHYPMPGPYPQQPTSYNVQMQAQNPPASNYNPGYPVQPGFQYNNCPVGMATFDSGARFDGIASPNIPPPPPGCAPNGAQMAAAQGKPVIGTQKKAGWLTGGSGGGVSFW